MDYRWVAKSIIPSVGKITKQMGYHRFQQALVHRILRFTPIICKEITDENLDWVDFWNFFELIFNNGHTKWHAIHTFLDLTHFLYSWAEFRNHESIPLVGPKSTHPTPWRLRPGKEKPHDV